jgi:hypothetical protein
MASHHAFHRSQPDYIKMNQTGKCFKFTTY